MSVIQNNHINYVTKHEIVQNRFQQDLRHADLLHSWISFAGPKTLQSFPPYCGEGLVHSRDRFLDPLPQVTEHSDHLDHAV